MNVTVFEVGPRDGLQNEPRALSVARKIEFVNGLAASGLREIELGAFVRPDRIPQMKDTEKLYEALHAGKIRAPRANFWALVPNLRGLERAMESGATGIAVFTAASETFNRKNIGMSIADSLREFGKVVRHARAWGMQVRGYVSTVFECPYEGKIKPKAALKVIDGLADLGVQQISIGDTIGAATIQGVDAVIPAAIRAHGAKKLAVHFHDTRGTALAHTLRSLEHGIRIVDSSAGGLGGCPYAPGATGNLATEDLVFMLEGMGVKTGVNLRKLSEHSLAFHRKIGREISSRYLQAFAASRRR